MYISNVPFPAAGNLVLVPATKPYTHLHGNLAIGQHDCLPSDLHPYKRVHNYYWPGKSAVTGWIAQCTGVNGQRIRNQKFCSFPICLLEKEPTIAFVGPFPNSTMLPEGNEGLS